MKKIISIFLVTSALFAFCSCSNCIDSANESSSENIEIFDDFEENDTAYSEIPENIYGSALRYNSNAVFSVDNIPDLIETQQINFQPIINRSLIGIIGDFILNKGKSNIQKKVRKMILDNISDTEGEVWDWLKMQFFRDLNETDIDEILEQINLLADSVEAIKYKLDLIMDKIDAAEMRTIINEKITRESQIRSADSSCMSDIMLIMESDLITNDDKVERIKARLKKWSSATIAGNSAYLNAAISLDLNVKTFQLSSPMTYLDIYDDIARKTYAWEAQGYDFRETMQCNDMAFLAQEVILTTLYYNLLNSEPDKIDELKNKFDKYVALSEKNNVIRDNDHIICQVNGANMKFEKSIKNWTSYLGGAASSYIVNLGTLASVPKDANLRESSVRNRIFRGISRGKTTDVESVKYVSLDSYLKILAFYNNQKSLYDIFKNEAGMDMGIVTKDASYFLLDDGYMSYARQLTPYKDSVYFTAIESNKSSESRTMESLKVKVNATAIIKWGFSGTYMEDFNWGGLIMASPVVVE